MLALLSAAVQASSLQVSDPFIRELPPGQTVSAAYFTLTNSGKAPVALVAATSDVAERVEIHLHRVNGGTMRMEQLHRVEVAAGGQLQFRPGGLHLMLIDLKRPLRAGDTVSVTLIDEKGGTYPLRLPVVDMRGGDFAAPAAAHDHHHSHH
jgi:copper(I)-binding protein